MRSQANKSNNLQNLKSSGLPLLGVMGLLLVNSLHVEKVDSEVNAAKNIRAGCINSTRLQISADFLQDVVFFVEFADIN